MQSAYPDYQAWIALLNYREAGIWLVICSVLTAFSVLAIARHVGPRSYARAKVGLFLAFWFGTAIMVVWSGIK